MARSLLFSSRFFGLLDLDYVSLSFEQTTARIVRYTLEPTDPAWDTTGTIAGSRPGPWLVRQWIGRNGWDGSRTGIADWAGSKLLFGSQQDRIGWVSDVSVRCLRVTGVGGGWVLTFWVPSESNIVPKI